MTQFNPYHEWLALDPQTTSFNYYRLLGLEDLEQDPEAIHTALEQTLQRVRACDPGAHAKRWASLIEEIEQAGKCLTDEWDKGDYDRQLDLSFRPQSQSGLSIEQPPAKKAAPAPQHVVTSKFKLAPEATTLQASMLPPRMGGAAATTGATQPDAQTANATENNRSAAVDAHVPPGTPDNRVKSDADQPADSGGYQVPSTAFVEAASDTDVPAVVDPGDHNLANTGGTPSPTPDTIGAHPVSTNGLAAAEDAVDAAPASNPMSAYRFPVNPQPDDPSDPAQSGELSEGDIPLATAIPSTELNSAPLAQPISGPDWPQTPVEPPMRPPPAPQPRRRSTLTRNTKLGIGTALVLVVAIVSFAWFSQNTAERSATVSQLPADRGQGAETTAGPNPEATDPEATDPEASDPEASDPEASDPEASDPE
ncbi:MAG: hypothetical protein CMJ59_17330, partial [Planctomycetaceae bacterium]|nr:hypothetical protein [Planctomycetaceae bacterium]